MTGKSIESVYEISPSPRLLIEASAGTGKTYTIVGIFIRLLVEENLTVDKILVVTFTKKATAELRDRILKRLRESIACIESGDAGGDTFLTELLKNTENRTEAAAKLKQAIRDFDDSSVFTIHGFCQKVINEEALTAGVPFEADLAQRDELLEEATEDFWRNFIDQYSSTETGQFLLNKLFSLADNPASLKKLLAPLFSKSYGRLEADLHDDIERYAEEIVRLQKELKSEWKNVKDEVFTIIEESGVKYKNHYASRFRKFDQLSNDDSLDLDKPESLQYFTSDYLYDSDNIKNDGEPVQPHPIFDLCSKYQQFIADIDKIKTTLFWDTFHQISERRTELAAGSSIMTYDDLLLTVKEALENSSTGSELSERLHQKYPYALVDEFQDTDPVQYSIFDMIYPTDAEYGSLMMIGDPKQAIYAFRGADVYAYINARDSVKGGNYTLKKNYRSRPKLIEAVNTAFGNNEDAFIEEKIRFNHSESGLPGLKDHYQSEGKAPVPFTFTVSDGVHSNKDEAKQLAFRSTVNQIGELLEKSQNGDVEIDGKKLEAGDIAVLINSHKDAEKIKRMLKQSGIDAVTYSREKVFETFEARRMELMMGAVLRPLNHTAFNNGLVSGFFGLDAEDLFNIKQDEDKKQVLYEELESLKETWAEKGFYPMFRKLLYTNGRMSALAKLENAERVITNLFQLADIASYAEREGGLSPESLYSWFRKEISDPAEDDERTLLLESDQNLVKISTIHNSKGLEFPVVFCPALWEGKRPKSSSLNYFEYHDEKTGELIINIDQHDTENRDLAQNRSRLESISEEIRKTYVALTRAKYECRVHWISHSDSNLCGLGALLLGKQELLNNMNLTVKEDDDLTDSSFIEPIHELAKTSPESITVFDADRWTGEIRCLNLKQDQIDKLEIRKYSGRAHLPVKKSMESFTSLVHHHEAAGEPDYDQYIDEYAESLQPVQTEEEEKTIFSFPRGAAAGTLMHKLFEHPDFDFTKAADADYSEIVLEILEQHGFEEKWSDVLQKMIRDVISANTGELSLAEVSAEDHIREMEFHLPVSNVRSDQLFEIIRSGTEKSSSESDLQNMLTGFIDLIVRQNGKYYILDYKSNHLGDSVADYSQENMEKAMINAGYDLQYHLYTAALVRYLEKRIPGFEYDRHFGGVYYLFLRGMQAGSGSGIYFKKPSERTIKTLTGYLDREREVMSNG